MLIRSPRGTSVLGLFKDIVKGGREMMFGGVPVDQSGRLKGDTDKPAVSRSQTAGDEKEQLAAKLNRTDDQQTIAELERQLERMTEDRDRWLNEFRYS